MKNLIPSTILLVSVLALSACTVDQGTSQPVPTATPVVKLEQQLAPPTSRPEPAFRTVLAMKADAATLKVGGKTRVKVSLAGLTQAATTFSTTLRVSDNLKITSITADEKVLPLAFKSDVAEDGKSASIAASNSKGFSGADVQVAEITVEAVGTGVGSVTIDANETSVLLPDNSDVVSLPADLPTVTITVQ